MAKWYLEHGLKITRVYEFIQFHPQPCFKELVLKIADARRIGDRDKFKEVLALTQKLIGNSLYSATLLNKDKHRNLTYHDDNNVTKL